MQREAIFICEQELHLRRLQMKTCFFSRTFNHDNPMEFSWFSSLISLSFRLYLISLNGDAFYFSNRHSPHSRGKTNMHSFATLVLFNIDYNNDQNVRVTMMIETR